MSPPPARGWTPAAKLVAVAKGVSPACAGMDPCTAPPQIPHVRLPRLRGDGPVGADGAATVTVSPPPARGWTRMGDVSPCALPVSPACAGMDLCVFHL